MKRLELIKPTLDQKYTAEEFKKEFFDCGERIINGSALFDKCGFEEWLIRLVLNSKKETVIDNWVVSDTFFAIRKRDGKIIGIIDIRHSLDNEILAEYAGHIGYSVRPSERKKGYASEMLSLALEYVRGIGLNKVMLGCYSDNTSSIRTIEKNGGILKENKLYTDGKPMKIFEITV